MTAFFRTGSFGSGTNVSRYSDVDYFAVIPTANLKANSGFSLSEVAASLRERFPLTENIRVNSPGVQIPFGLDGSEHTEVIPVDATGTTRLGFRQFDIADGYGSWMFSAPESHKVFVDHHDARLNGRLKPLIRCVKAWKFYRNVPIRSFYLEMFVTFCMLEVATIVYSIDIPEIFDSLVINGCNSIDDPRFSDMTIKGCYTDAQRVDALSKAGNAAKWSSEAWRAEADGRTAEAFHMWNLVFNYEFPNYNPT